MESKCRRVGGRRWLTAKVARLTSEVGRVLFPHFCLRCGAEGELMCNNCELKYASQRGILFSLDRSIRCFSAGQYADPILRTLLHLYKYGRVSEAGEIITRLSVACAGRQSAALLAGMDQPVVMPLPMNPVNQAVRGFNQTEALASALAADFELDTATKVVSRSFSWKPQAKISDYKIRRSNVRNSFIVQSGAQLPEEIILVDDVLTTGSTASDCVRALLQSGVKKISIFTALKG